MVLSSSASGPRRKCPSEATRTSGTGRIFLQSVVARVHHEGRGKVDLAEVCAPSGDHRPAPLSIPLLDPVRAAPGKDAVDKGLSDVEAALTVRRQSPWPGDLAELCASSGDNDPDPLSI